MERKDQKNDKQQSQQRPEISAEDEQEACTQTRILVIRKNLEKCSFSYAAFGGISDRSSIWS